MKRLLLLDAQNYNEELDEIRRIAVRGIISVEGKMIFAEDRFGVLKLPGGGQEPEESDLQTLIREVREETGYNVIPDTVKPFGYIEEKRKALHEEMIWHQFSYLYFCDVESEQGECEYSENEKLRGMHFKACTLDEAIRINREQRERLKKHDWNEREYQTLLLIKDHAGEILG